MIKPNMDRQRITGFVGRTAAAALLLALAACTDDTFVETGRTTATEATPVRFEISCAPLDGMQTRTKPKARTWQQDDIIQIRAEFTGKDVAAEDKIKYGCYRYDAGSDEWNPNTTDDQLMWPVGVETATFDAYYLAELKGPISLTEGKGESSTYLLGDIAEEGDPLHAKTESLDYGRSVNLEFKHLCTHLELTDVKTDLSNGYWLYKAADNQIPNAYKLAYDKDNGFTFSFTTADTCNTDLSSASGSKTGRYYILRSAVPTAGGKYTVDFYLAGKNSDATLGSDLTDAYGDCTLAYRNDRPYLGFSNITSLNSLEAGTHYELSIEKELGAIPQPEQGFPDPWEPSKDDGDVDIPEFLDALTSSTPKDYKDSNGNLVLKSEGEPYPRLMRDVNFRGFDLLKYIEGEYPYDGQGESSEPHKGWKMPRLSKIFDGNFKTFYNVAYPIFDDLNNGEIYNLAIRNSKCDLTIEEIKAMRAADVRGSQDGVPLMTQFGLLACTMNGRCENLLLDNVEMKLNIDRSVSNNQQERIYMIGSLFGNLPSDLTDFMGIERVEIRNDVKVTVDTGDFEAGGGASGNAYLDEVQTCFIGGLIGQLGSSLNTVTMGSKGKCTVKGKIRSGSPVIMGGIVGRSFNSITNVNLHAEVDGSAVNALSTYIGGICGEIVNQSEEFGLLQTAQAVVTVTGGQVTSGQKEETKSHAYTGGIAAVVNSVTCSDVLVSGTVKGGTQSSADSSPDRINYATGGGFGYVTADGADVNINGCRVQTTVTEATVIDTSSHNDTGMFAGLSKYNEQTFTGKGNSALTGGYGNIGRVGNEND